MKKIMIDPGHGGRYPGAIGYKSNISGEVTKVKESDINLKASMYLSIILEQAGMEVYTLRETDKDFGPTVREDLMVRCEMENLWEPDAYVSLHCNAFKDNTVHGFEIWTSPGETGADSLAESIYQSVREMEDRPRLREDKEANFYVLMNTKAPAVLIEMGFMTNSNDLLNLTSHRYLEGLMAAVARGIKSWRM